MELNTILLPSAVIADLKVTSKKQALQALADVAADLSGIESREIFDAILQREKLGSTGVGSGVAIPHGKFSNIDGIIGVFARLSAPIEFDAIDDQPVDLIFLLLARESAGADHLKALSRVARLFRDKSRLAGLRAAGSAEDLYAMIINEPEAHAA